MDSDPVYSSDCYLQKRGSMRKGFGGNYRRASASFAVPRTKPSSESGSDARLRYGSLKSSSFCHTNGSSEPDQLHSSSSSSSCVSLAAYVENQQQLKNSQLSDRHQETMDKAENQLLMYTGRKDENLGATSSTSAVPSAGSQIQGQHGQGDGSGGKKQQIPLAGSKRSLVQLEEEGTSGVSVMEFVRSIESADARLCSAAEDKPKTVTQNRVAELRETMLHRSSENLAADTSCGNPLRVAKRPVSAVIECSLGTFPKIPISLIQRRSIGSLLKPSFTSVQQCPSSTILNPVFEPKSNAGQTECNMCNSEIGGSQNNSTRRRSFKLWKSLDKKVVGGNMCSVQEKSNVESNNKATNETDASCDMSVAGADVLAGSLVKTDSFDSGIDTKTDWFGNKSSPDVVERLPVSQFQMITNVEKLSHFSGHRSADSYHFQCNDSVSLGQCSEITEMEKVPESILKGETVNISTSMTFVDLELDELAKISSEEVRYQGLAARVLSRLKDSDCELCSVLIPSEVYRTPFHYMVDVIQSIKIPEIWLKQPAAYIDAVCETIERSLEEDKTALLSSIKSKLEVIKKNREHIRQKVMERKDLESQVSNVIKCRVEKKKYDKYCLYLSELDKVLRLMFMLASRLANTENALNHLRSAESETLSKSLRVQRANLIEKLDDAKFLKDGIDHRSKVVNSFLKVSLSASEYAAYLDLVATVVRLHFLHQWTEHRVILCERQMKALNAADIIKSGSLRH